MKIPDVYKSSIALGWLPKEAQEMQAGLEKRITMNPVMVDVINELKSGATGARIEIDNMTISVINDNGEIVGRADACGDTYDLDEDELLNVSWLDGVDSPTITFTNNIH